ncbi:MAG TPA: hypothetical protein VF618_14505 [Thermoanaerobaculia bacterium]
MSNQKPSERIVELLNETIDVLMRGEAAPDSPIVDFVPSKTRRTMRRHAERLRRGEAQPRWKNLYTANQLAGILENTVKRDEIFQHINEEFLRLGREMVRVMREDPEGTRKSMETVFLETLLLAKAQGPGSEAAARYRQLERLKFIAKTHKSGSRRQKGRTNGPRYAAAHAAEGRIPMIPAEFLDSAPEGETVIPFPAVGEDSGRERVLIRIGAGASSWIGNFECGFKTVCTVSMMPDCKHLFVSANGAGYIIHERSRKLVERTGTEIVGVDHNPEMTLFVVNHNDKSFEVFGTEGRLGKREG